MAFMRFVSRDEWNGLRLSIDQWRMLQALIWRDPGYEEVLKSLAHNHRICPVIEKWREILKPRV